MPSFNFPNAKNYCFKVVKTFISLPNWNANERILWNDKNTLTDERRNFNEETLMDVWAKLNVGDCGRAHKVFVYSKDG